MRVLLSVVTDSVPRVIWATILTLNRSCSVTNHDVNCQNTAFASPPLLRPLTSALSRRLIGSSDAWSTQRKWSVNAYARLTWRHDDVVVVVVFDAARSVGVGGAVGRPRQRRTSASASAAGVADAERSGGGGRHKAWPPRATTCPLITRRDTDDRLVWPGGAAASTVRSGHRCDRVGRRERQANVVANGHQLASERRCRGVWTWGGDIRSSSKDRYNPDYTLYFVHSFILSFLRNLMQQLAYQQFYTLSGT